MLPGLVIFDCDGVLVDSEPVANRVTAEAVSALGWAMTPEEADRAFLGMNIDDIARVDRIVLLGQMPRDDRPAV